MKKFFTGVCLDVFWSRRLENLTENPFGMNFSKNGLGIFQEVTRMVEPAYTNKSTLSVNYGPQFARNQPFGCAIQTALRGRTPSIDLS